MVVGYGMPLKNEVMLNVIVATAAIADGNSYGATAVVVGAFEAQTPCAVALASVMEFAAYYVVLRAQEMVASSEVHWVSSSGLPFANNQFDYSSYSVAAVVVARAAPDNNDYIPSYL